MRSLSCLVLLVAALRLTAAEPTVRDLGVRGLRAGGATTVVVSGDDLGKAPKLLLPFAAKQTLKPGNTDKQATFDVELSDAPPGMHHLRVVTDGGVSLPIVIGVDALEQKPFAAKVETLPVALSGTLAGAAVLETTFSGKAGQKVVVEVEAARIGGKLRPVLHLSNAKKLQLEWAWGTPALSGDARLTATLPADGAYTVALHDLEYAGQNPGAFRLKIGSFDYADAVFPPVVGKDAKSVELLGSRAVALDYVPGLRLSGAHPLPWPKEGAWSGPRPFVEVSSRPEFLEGSAPSELPAGRVGVSGKLTAPNEEDKYRVAVEPKSKVRFEVFAERLGSPLDAALTVYDDKGARLAQAEDSPGTLDPVLEFAVPDKVAAVVVGVVDSQGRGSPRGVYRLTVDPVNAEGAGDFRLTTPLQRLSLPAGGRAVVPVFAERRGFAGAIDLTATLPAGLKLEGNVIPPGADGALVTVTASADVPAALAMWYGSGSGGNVARPVSVKGHPLERLQPWLANEFAVAPTSAKAADFAIDWKNLPADAGLAPAGKLALPVALTRTDVASPVRLTLLTSQAPPLANGQPDPNRAIRAERPIELGAKASDGEVPVVVPPELPADAYQVAVLAELLTADKQRVRATAVTPVRTLKVNLPLALKLDSSKLEVKLDAKANAALEVKGAVERLNGATGDVVLSLTGLPTGVPAVAPVAVKAADTAFAFKLTLPPSTPPGETKLTLSATIAPDPKQPAARVKARDVNVTLNVIPPK